MTMTPDELSTQKMLTSLASDVASLKSLVEQLLKSIHGNGQPGLITTVAKLESDTEPLRGKPSLVERVAKLETKVGVIAGLAGFFASVIAEVIKNLF